MLARCFWFAVVERHAALNSSIPWERRMLEMTAVRPTISYIAKPGQVDVNQSKSNMPSPGLKTYVYMGALLGLVSTHPDRWTVQLEWCPVLAKCSFVER